MKPPLVWVIGKGGLLGTSLSRAISRRASEMAIWECIVPEFSWDDKDSLSNEFALAIRSFCEMSGENYCSWIILWAAGASVVGSSPKQLQSETETWKLFLDLLGKTLTSLNFSSPGVIFLASSAGGVYGKSPDPILTESSPCLPISEYGWNKLQQENLLRDWAATRPSVSYLIGRISNLYGLTQNLQKPQGLISHMSWSFIYHKPVHIYVPLDTIRDYFFVKDCAEHVLACVEVLNRNTENRRYATGVVKIFASEQPCSIARIVGIFSQIAKHYPKIISAKSPVSQKQPPKLIFRSEIWRELSIRCKTDLLVGINSVYKHHLTLFREGQLPAPKLC